MNTASGHSADVHRQVRRLRWIAFALRGSLSVTVRTCDPCQVWWMIDKRPGLIACCVDVADVISAVNFARGYNLTLAVRGGGHNEGGLGI